MVMFQALGSCFFGQNESLWNAEWREAPAACMDKNGRPEMISHVEMHQISNLRIYKFWCTSIGIGLDWKSWRPWGFYLMVRMFFECRTQHGRLAYVQGEHSVIGQNHKTFACVKPRADPDLFWKHLGISRNVQILKYTIIGIDLSFSLSTAQLYSRPQAASRLLSPMPFHLLKQGSAREQSRTRWQRMR